MVKATQKNVKRILRKCGIPVTKTNVKKGIRFAKSVNKGQVKERAFVKKYGKGKLPK